MNQDQPSIKAIVQSALALAASAQKTREAIAKILPTTATPRDHAVLHRAYVVLGDFVVGFNTLSDKIAECVAINQYLA